MTMMSNRRCAALACVLSGLLAPMILSEAVLAQAHKQGAVIMQRDEGDGPGAPQIMFFAGTDFADLKQPDFIHRDLPVFQEKLVLSAEQWAAVERLLEAYLESFKAITVEHLPKGVGVGPLVLDMRDGPAAAHGVGAEGEEEEGGAWLDELGLEGLEGELPEGMGIGVDVRVGGGAIAWGGEPGDEGPSVAISFESPDGQELPPEVREKLEKKAAAIAEKIKQQMAEQKVDGGGGPGMIKFGMGDEAAISIEELQARQAELAEKAEDFREAKASLRQRFVTEVQTNLAEAQIERWPALERALLRDKSLPQGRLSGERTDLIKALKSLELSERERQAVAEQADAYELALDHALRQRNQIVRESEPKVNQAMQAQDPDTALEHIDRATNARIAVRRVNEQYTDIIAPQLPANRAEQFRNDVLRISYPRIYAKTYGMKAFAAAKKIEGLDAKTAASISDLEHAYLTELHDLNAQIRSTVDEHQPSEPRRGVEHMKAVLAGEFQPGEPRPGGPPRGDGENPVAEAFTRRRALDEMYVKLVREMLTPEQAVQLPKPPSRKPMEPIVIELPSTPQ